MLLDCLEKIENQQILFECLPHNKDGKLDWTKFDGKKVYFIRNNKKDFFVIEKYDNQERKIFTNYHGYKTFTYQSSFLKSQISKVLGYKKYGYKYKIGEVINTIKIIDRKTEDNGRRKYKYHCLIDGNEDWTWEQTITYGKYICNVCSNQKIMIGINDIPTTDPWMIPYFQGGYDEAKQYMKCSKTKIYPICPDCGKVRKKKISIYTIHKTRSIACNCGDGISYPNKFMYSLLSQLKINFESEYSPEWISPKRYDFFIPSLKLIIEMDGGLGHGKKVIGNKISLEESLEIDNYKDNIAAIHNLKVIRIECDKSEFDYIVSNIKEALKNYFDLSNINWDICESQALSNRVKYVCDEYERNKPVLTSELAELLHMNKNVVASYLNKGRKIGWTTYNPEEMIKSAKIKSSTYMKDTYSKPVYVYSTNGEFINEYSSQHEIEKNSIKDFGFFLSYKVISKCCNHQLNSYKGLIFTRNKEDVNLKCDMRKYNREICCYDLEMNFISKYKSASDASKKTNIGDSNIRRCCNGVRKTAGGYIWRYADEVDLVT